jgi:hypothetical protein
MSRSGLTGVADLDLADLVGAVQPVQRGDECVVGLLLKPALGGEHVDRDRDDQVFVRSAPGRGSGSNGAEMGVKR